MDAGELPRRTGMISSGARPHAATGDEQTTHSDRRTEQAEVALGSCRRRASVPPAGGPRGRHRREGRARSPAAHHSERAIRVAPLPRRERRRASDGWRWSPRRSRRRRRSSGSNRVATLRIGAGGGCLPLSGTPAGTGRDVEPAVDVASLETVERHAVPAEAGSCSAHEVAGEQLLHQHAASRGLMVGVERPGAGPRWLERDWRRHRVVQCCSHDEWSFLSVGWLQRITDTCRSVGRRRSTTSPGPARSSQRS